MRSSRMLTLVGLNESLGTSPPRIFSLIVEHPCVITCNLTHIKEETFEIIITYVFFRRSTLYVVIMDSFEYFLHLSCNLYKISFLIWIPYSSISIKKKIRDNILYEYNISKINKIKILNPEISLHNTTKWWQKS